MANPDQENSSEGKSIVPGMNASSETSLRPESVGVRQRSHEEVPTSSSGPSSLYVLWYVLSYSGPRASRLLPPKILATTTCHQLQVWHTKNISNCVLTELSSLLEESQILTNYYSTRVSESCRYVPSICQDEECIFTAFYFFSISPPNI